MLARLFESRAEVIAVVNAGSVLITQFGLSVSDVQQAAITTFLNALLLLGIRLIRPPTA